MTFTHIKPIVHSHNLFNLYISLELGLHDPTCTMNESGCFLLKWDTGDSIHYYIQFDSLEEHLDYFFCLDDLSQIYSIQFNNRFCIIPYYDSNYGTKTEQIQRLVNEFESFSVITNTIKCSDCDDEWMVI